MNKLNGYSVLIVEPDLDTALVLQDSLAMDGARVLTAYGVDRALLHAETTQLSAAVLGKSLSVADRNSIFRQLSQRKIPIMLNEHLDDRHQDPTRHANCNNNGIAVQLAEAILGQPASNSLQR
jgi:CheY-like chemotaxis protein